MNGNELKYGTANNRLMKIVRTQFDTDPGGQQSSTFFDPTTGELLGFGGGGAAPAGGGGFPPPPSETATTVWTKYYFYSDDGNVFEDEGTVERVVTYVEGEHFYSAVRFGYGANARTVTHVLGEEWDNPDVLPGYPYKLTFARQFRYDGARQRYLDREFESGDLSLNIVRSDTWSDYDGTSIYADFGFDGFDVLEERRSYLPGLAITDQLAGGGAANTTYLHTSALGSTMATSDSSGTGSFDSAYTAFGEQIMGQTQRYGFAGAHGYQSHDEFPYMHLGHRYYNPTTGRFLQRDPIGIRGGSNVYVYVLNRPVMGVDPTGKGFWGAVWSGIKVVVGIGGVTVGVAIIVGGGSVIIGGALVIGGLTLGINEIWNIHNRARDIVSVIEPGVERRNRKVDQAMDCYPTSD